MLATILLAVGLFAGTNIDDIIVITLFFLAVQRGTLAGWKVVVGQYLGVSTLIAASLLAALGLTLLSDRWVGLLGLIPLGLGVWGFIRFFRALRRPKNDQAEESALKVGGLIGVTAVTLANGADNIAVYTPVFRSMAPPDIVTTVAVFLILVGVWILAGWLIGSREAVLRVISRVEEWLVPSVFVILGLLILLPLFR